MRMLCQKLVLALLLCSSFAYGQEITGKVLDGDTKEPLPGVNVYVKGKSEGNYTLPSGTFAVRVKSFPVTLTFSFIGFERVEMTFNEPKDILLELKSAPTFIDEVVVGASRSEQRKLESPVTIERLSSKDISNSPQVNYYDMIQGLKGVDVTVSSIGFTSVTTRGFNTSGNTNFLQMVDGMDNQAPGLNFPLGNVIGLTQLDVDNIEILSGASSALYGSRGLNGTMIMKGKDPFQYQGLSVLYTQGVNHVNNTANNDPVPTSPYTDFTLRYAKKLSDKFAFKVNFQLTKANDWVAHDMSNKNGTGTALTDPNYNGVNMYGSATSVDITPFLQYALSQDPTDLGPVINPLLAPGKPIMVARTGYPEYGYLNNNVQLIKSNAEVRYKVSENTEAIISGTVGTGNIVYTNDTRYQIRDYVIEQYRAELRSKNWFFRTYTTRENSGKTLIAGPTAQLINEAWKPSYDPNTGDGWYPQYTSALVQSLATGSNVTNAHLAARAYADQGRPELGSTQFVQLKNQISQTPITQGGTLFLDRSKLYNTAFQYNFSNVVKWAEIIAGVNWRLYRLDSKGTLFPDDNGPIDVNEYSGYVQVVKKLADDRLSLSGSLRFDKNTLFIDPKTTSRFTSVYRLNDQGYLRFSYQNAYSFPSNVQSLQHTLNGSNPSSFAAGGSAYLLNGTFHFDQYAPYTLESVQKYQQSNNQADLQRFIYNDIKPQSANAFELGYATVINKNLMLDVLGYYTIWTNFIGYKDVANTYVVTNPSASSADPSGFLDPSKYTKYNIAYNGGQSVNTFGYAASLSYNMQRNFVTKVNFYSDHMKNGNEKQISYFNTPSYHLNFEFGNSGLGKKKLFSFNTTLRFKPSYHYEVMGGLGQGTVPSSAVIDAQVGYRFQKIKSILRIGATNITNQYYSTGMANPMIGGMYYATIGYNISN
ncbi:MAG: carboxypeptidase-like regulatory domain-containing protein [Cyclobacteriaceae bacterium]